jgi:hypothetical protein
MIEIGMAALFCLFSAAAGFFVGVMAGNEKGRGK